MDDWIAVTSFLRFLETVVNRCAPPLQGVLAGHIPGSHAALVLDVLALIGAALSSAMFLCVDIVDRNAVPVVFVMYVIFALCVTIAPQLYPMLEDRTRGPDMTVSPLHTHRG